METSAAVDSGCFPAADGCTEVGSFKEDLHFIHGKDDQKLPELPPEKTNWITTIPELTHHLATLYVLKLVLEGRIGLASITVCKFTFTQLPCCSSSIRLVVICASTQGLLLAYLGLLGTTIGAHRLWSHRSFKANRPVRYFLAICQTFAVQVRLAFRVSIPYVLFEMRITHNFLATLL